MNALADVNNCGACGKVCASGASCVVGNCITPSAGASNVPYTCNASLAGTPLSFPATFTFSGATPAVAAAGSRVMMTGFQAVGVLECGAILDLAHTYGAGSASVTVSAVSVASSDAYATIVNAVPAPLSFPPVTLTSSNPRMVIAVPAGPITTGPFTAIYTTGTMTFAPGTIQMTFSAGGTTAPTFCTPSASATISSTRVTATCASPSDCASGVCSGGACLAPTCGDGVQNGKESAVDCGGGICAACGTGSTCGTGTDCTSGVCSGGVCQASSCGNGPCLPTIAVSTDTVVFPATGVGTVSSPQTVTLLNKGLSPLQVSAISLSGRADFVLETMPLPLNLAPGESAPFTVSFRPTGTGSQTATVQVSSNDPATPTLVVTLYGTGT